MTRRMETEGGMIPINGDMVRVRAAGRGWSLARLARELGVSRQAVHRLVTRHGRHRAATVARLCAALGCVLTDLQRAPTQSDWALLGRSRSC